MTSSIRYSKLSFVFFLALFVFAGCDGSGANEDEAPPPIPAEAFALQADLFSQVPTSKSESSTVANFAAAALRVWPTSLILTANLVVPSAVTQAALQVDPEFIDGAWVWDATANISGQPFQFKLSGTIEGSSVGWSMHVDGNQLDDFELYTGTTDLASRTGSWQLYYLLEGERQLVLSAGFSVDDEGAKEVTFTVPDVFVQAGGDSVRYTSDGNEKSFLWTQQGEGLEHLVNWNEVTKAGSITAGNFNGGARACWGTDLHDAGC
jgi:hypothetical protein